MKTGRLAFILLQGITLVVALSLVPTETLWAERLKDAAPPSMADVYGHLPLSFEANQGQSDSRVQFITRGPGHRLFLTPSDAELTLRTGETKTDRRTDQQDRLPSSAPLHTQSTLRMTFKGANPDAEAVGLDKLPGIVNYFIGADPSRWRTNIATYQKVVYKHVYAGIDLIYYGNHGQLEYDLIVAPGANPNLIRLGFEGADQVQVDPASGDLVLTLSEPSTSFELGIESSELAAGATLRLQKPVVYQLGEHGDKQFIAGNYLLLVSETLPSRHATASAHSSETSSPSSPIQHIALQVASYDTSKPLIIDPVLSWATYLGGSGTDNPLSIAVDTAGQAYVTGHTNTPSSGFPDTAGSAIQNAYGGGSFDAFVTKLNAAGTALVYSTYLGGSGQDIGQSIAVDSAGNAYVTGYTSTSGSGFPGTAGSSIQNSNGGGNDAFVTKLNATGTALLYSTYLGGSGDDQGWGIALDTTNNAYITGFTTTSGSGFPGTAGSLIQNTNGGGGIYGDAFVTKLNAAGTALVYSTYLGGSGNDAGYLNGIAVDTAGQAYVTGFTDTPGSGFPGTAGSSIQNSNGGGQDAFVTKLNAAGTALVYSTYLGGTGTDISYGIAVDTGGQAYVTGQTNTPGSGFPGTAGSSIQSTHAGGPWDAFVTKLNAAGTALFYSTYLGGSGDDQGKGIALDSAGNAFVAGTTTTAGSGFPGTAGSPVQSTNGGGFDAFVTKLNTAGTALVSSTYLGGSGTDGGSRIAVDTAGQAYVTGQTNTAGSGFPGTAASSIQGTNAGDYDGFVTKIQFVIPVNIDIKPGSFPNSINLGSNGTVPVAIHGSATFDASQIDPLTVTLADAKAKLKGKGTPVASLQDVNGDGFLDLVVHVSTSALVLNANDTEATVQGTTMGGDSFSGKDSVRIVP
jgi:hypothetical protein